VLVDLPRDRSGKFCDTGNCGNRQHMAAYREQRATDGRLPYKATHQRLR
jgi:predicted RNA-binding Zn ribbon-like protein